MNRLSREDEDRLYRAVKRAALAVDNDGLAPTEAITKVAREIGLEAGLVPRVVEAYNTGRTTYQRESGKGILEKFADFDLADTDKVLSNLYPEKVDTPVEATEKSAISSDYTVPFKPLLKDQYAAREKAASYKLPTLEAPEPYARDAKTAMRKAFGQAERQKDAFERARAEKNAAKDQFLCDLGALQEHFKQADYSVRKLYEIVGQSRLIFGDPGVAAVNYIYEKRGSQNLVRDAHVVELVPVDRNSGPYPLIAAVIKSGEAMLDANDRFTDIKDDAQEKIAEALTPYVMYDQPEQPRSVLLGKRSEKRSAGFFTGMAGGQLMEHALRRSEPKTTSQLVDDQAYSLTDPNHENALRMIQAKAHLSDFMANDPVISTHDPNEVLKVYNEVAQLSPSSVTQPALLGPILRQRLSQGAAEPFEAAEVAKVEKTLRDTGYSSIPNIVKGDKGGQPSVK